jgi:hypothetical protein
MAGGVATGTAVASGAAPIISLAIAGGTASGAASVGGSNLSQSLALSVSNATGGALAGGADAVQTLAPQSGAATGAAQASGASNVIAFVPRFGICFIDMPPDAGRGEASAVEPRSPQSKAEVRYLVSPPQERRGGIEGPSRAVATPQRQRFG